MIIKSSRIKSSSGHGAVWRHVANGKDNEKIAVLQGGELDLSSAMDDAREWQRTYGLRHFSVSPQEMMTRSQMRDVLLDLAKEFGFDAAAATVIEHSKARSDGTSFNRHWHILIAEVDARTGRVMNSAHTYSRQEKISRIAEVRCAHAITAGRHNRAVVSALRIEGYEDVADKLASAGITEGTLPHSAFTANQHQIAKRQGNCLPEVKALVSEAWQRSDSAKAFAAAVGGLGLTVRQGDKKDTWVIEKDGEVMGALHRFAGVRKAAVVARMKQEVHRHENQDQSVQNGRSTAPAHTVSADLHRGEIGARESAPSPRSAGGTVRERGRRSARSSHGAARQARSAADEDRAAPGDRRQRLIAAARLRAAFKKHPRDLDHEIKARAQALLTRASTKRTSAAGGGQSSWVGRRIESRIQARGVSWRWEHQGFETQVFDQFVMVRGDDWRIADDGDRCLIDTVSPEGVETLITKAKRDWNGTIACFGSQEFLENAWLEAKRQGVAFWVKDQPNWQPPEHIMIQWTLESEALSARLAKTDELTCSPPQKFATL